MTRGNAEIVWNNDCDRIGQSTILDGSNITPVLKVQAISWLWFRMHAMTSPWLSLMLLAGLISSTARILLWMWDTVMTKMPEQQPTKSAFQGAYRRRP